MIFHALRMIWDSTSAIFLSCPLSVAPRSTEGAG